MKKPKEKQEKKPQKTIYLKQYFIVSLPDENNRTKAAFILHTCALNARKEFELHTGLQVGTCQQSAESELVKEDLERHDFWKEGRNQEVLVENPKEKMSESAINYFKMKDRAEKVQAAKRQLKIRDWESATVEQLKKLDEILEK